MDGRETYGLTLEVYRSNNPDGSVSDCTAGGITSRANRLTLVGFIDPDKVLAGDDIGARIEPMPREAQVFGPRPDAPPVALRRTHGPSGSVALVPVVVDDHGAYRVVDQWVMAGGNYAASCDSRVSALIRRVGGVPFYGAVAVHDRIE